MAHSGVCLATAWRYDRLESMSADRNVPATKGDIEDLRGELHAQLDSLRADTKQDLEMLRSEMNHGYQDLKEMMCDNETRLLDAFYSFAK